VEAIVLAGGLGTRLRKVVSDLPKPMAPIGDRPFLYYILQYLHKQGVKRIILSVGYKWESIKECFGEAFEDMELIYSVENEPLGTGGAIKKAFSFVKSEEVYIVNGDTFFDVPLNSLKLEKSSQLMLSLKEMKDFDRYGCVESSQNGIVTTFTEKEHRKLGNINGGIYLVSKDIFKPYRVNENFSFEEFMQNNVEKLQITSKVFDNYFIDIGIPEDYATAQRELKEHI
jgi:D-glycero-alpha-D-manno-heptose 1-phosphate guanylyltransferase